MDDDSDDFIELLRRECSFDAMRASGPGGQNVNKVNSKVRLRWNINCSKLLSWREKNRFREIFSSRVTESGDVIITASTSRNRGDNETATICKLEQLVLEAKKKVIKRVKTRPTRASNERRLTGKKLLSQTKSQRGRPESQ